VPENKQLEMLLFIQKFGLGVSVAAPTLIKKENKFSSSITKSRRERLQTAKGIYD
jgi:hypothetical protein